METIIKELKNYLEFSRKKNNFIKDEDYIFNKNLADRVGILLSVYEELKEKAKKCEYYEMVADELYKNSISKDKIKAKIEEIENMTLVEIAEKVEGHTFYLSLEGLSEGKKIASYFLQSLLEEKETNNG